MRKEKTTKMAITYERYVLSPERVKIAVFRGKIFFGYAKLKPAD